MDYNVNKILPFIRKPVDNGDIITSDTRYYLDFFENNLSNNKIIKWNWSAGLFGGLWLLYRKMYSYAFANYFIWFLIGKAFLSGISSSPGISNEGALKRFLITYILLWLVEFILLGFLGSGLYASYIKDKIDRAERPPESAVAPELVWLLLIASLVIH